MLDAKPEVLSAIFETNVKGPMLVTQAFLPLLRKSQVKKLAVMSSTAGSIGTMQVRRNEPGIMTS